MKHFFLLQESAKTKEQLVSENMVLTKKLDALEEFRIQVIIIYSLHSYRTGENTLFPHHY